MAKRQNSKVVAEINSVVRSVFDDVQLDRSFVIQDWKAHELKHWRNHELSNLKHMAFNMKLKGEDVKLCDKLMSRVTIIQLRRHDEKEKKRKSEREIGKSQGVVLREMGRKRNKRHILIG